MAYEMPFLRLVAQGTIYTKETFAFSMSLIRIPPFAGPPPTEVPTAVVNAFAARFAASGLISQGAALTLLKLNEIGTDGKYTQDTTVLYEYPTPVAGVSTNQPAPQVSLVVSLDTGATRGRAARGRFYLPLPGATVTSDGRISSSDANSAAVQAGALLDSINDAFTGMYQVGVTSDIGAGQQRDVHSVRVGRVLDTIRSRRSSLDEDYQEVLLT